MTDNSQREISSSSGNPVLAWCWKSAQISVMDHLPNTVIANKILSNITLCINKNDKQTRIQWQTGHRMPLPKHMHAQMDGQVKNTITQTAHRMESRGIKMVGKIFQLGHMQVCTSLQTDNHASNPPLSFYRPDALPATQPTASKHWRQDSNTNLFHSKK